jgi:hypothetical protein
MFEEVGWEAKRMLIMFHERTSAMYVLEVPQIGKPYT